MRNKVIQFIAATIVYYIQKYSWNDSIQIEIQEAVGVMLAQGTQVTELPTAPEHVEETAAPAEPVAPVETVTEVQPETTVGPAEETAPPVVEETTPPAPEVQPETPVTHGETVTPPVAEEVNGTPPGDDEQQEQTPPPVTPEQENHVSDVVEEVETPAVLTLESIWAVVQDIRQQLNKLVKI